MKLPEITLEWMQGHHACWCPQQLDEKFFKERESWTPQDFLTKCHDLELKFGSYGDWIVLRVFNELFADVDKETGIGCIYDGDHTDNYNVKFDQVTWLGHLVSLPEIAYLHAILILDVLEDSE